MIFRISLAYFVTAFILLCSGHINAQPWHEALRTTKPNFFKMRDAGNIRFEKVKDQKGKGYKAFKRWEQYWQPRVFADGSFPTSEQTIKAWNEYQDQAATNNISTSISGSSWTSLGPNSSNGGYAGIGRINRLTFHPTNSNIFFASTAGGGLWKTINGGTSWTPLTDQLSTIGTTGLAIHPTDPNIMYLATGDGDGYDSYSFGVLKSTDGGINWSATGLSFPAGDGYVIFNLIMHPTDPNILLAATNAGLYRTADGGANWTRPINTEVIYDVEFKPGSPATIYASSNTGVYRSTNTGVNWTKTFTVSNAYRIFIAVSPANPEFVGAIASNNYDYGFLGFYGSTDGGGSFSLRSSTPNLLGWSNTGSDTGGQGWYDLCIAVAPDNINNIYIGGVNSWKSSDGGFTWKAITHWYNIGTVAEMHADQHDLAFQSSSALFAANDGGIYRSTNGGTNWTDLSNGMVISQMYRAAASQKDSKIITGLQDNGTKLRGTTGNWADHIGGDGMDCGIDQSNASYLYGTLYYGKLIRSSDGGNNFNADITPFGNANGNWVSPFVIDPTTSSTIYLGLRSLYKSTDRGGSWTSISGTVNGTSALNVIAVAPSNSNVIYMTWAQKIARTTNGGTSWTTYNTPSSSYLTSLDVDSVNANLVYATFSNFTAGEKVYRSADGGATWTNISGTLPNIPANKIILQRSSSIKAMYLGMDAGVYYRDSTMSDWVLYNTNLPNVEISDLEIRYSDKKLIAATYGRGLWESPLYEPPVTGVNIYSFSPVTTGKDSTVTINGANFTGATSVKFGGTEAASFNVVSSTQITAVVGTGSSGLVTVTTPEGSGSKSGFTFINAPAITSFTPTSAGPGATVTITGTNLTGASAVHFGSTSASSFNVVSATQITAVVSSGSSGSLTVRTPGGLADLSGFTFVSAPIVSVNSSTACQGDSVILTATGADTYTWSPSTGLSATTGATVKAAPGTTTRYVVLGTKTACSCSDTDTATVTITPTATAAISVSPSTSLVSPVTAVTFTANVTGGGASPQYQWKWNGQNVGTNSATYSNSSWNHGDSVFCVLTSNANCISGNPFKSNTVKISLSSGINYCNSSGTTTREYLNRVQIATVMDSISGDNSGYGNFKHKMVLLQTGSSYTIQLTPAWKGSARSVGYAVWIDYNKNGIFTDAGELVYSRARTTATLITGSFTVPTGAGTGYAGMRVSMRYNAIPGSCDVNIAGEVEDYTVQLVQPTPDTEAPTTPTNLSSSNVGSSSLTLNWTASTDNVGVTSYQVYRNGTLVSTVSTNTASITGLSPLTTYSFFIVAKDAAGNSSSQSSPIDVTTTGITYCASSGTNSGQEFIKEFRLGTFTNANNTASGYANYTNLTINAVRGSSNALTITPGWSGAIRSEGYRVWIDINQDGDFADAGELVFNQNKTTKTSITGTIIIPAASALGNTRLRVSMKYNASPTACENNFSGEVEDYTLNITATPLTNKSVDFVSAMEVQMQSLALYPNPSSGNAMLALRGFAPGSATIRVVDIHGRVIVNKEYILSTDQMNLPISIARKPAGLYLVQVIQGGKVSGVRFVKQ